MNTYKPLRILHVIDHFYPQLGYQETFLSKIETEQGYHVIVLTSNLYAKTIYKVNKEILGYKKTEIGLSVERGIKTIRLSAFHIPTLNTLFLLDLEEVIIKLRPDVIICHGIVSLTSIRVARLKKQLPNVKIIVDDHMTYINTRGGIFRYVYYLFKRMFMPLILESSDEIVAVTFETKRFIIQMYGVPAHKIKVIPLGVDTALFIRDQTARIQIRSKCGIHDEDVVFIYAGKIVPTKGIHILIQAANNIFRKHMNVKVMLVGGIDKKYQLILNKMVNASGFQDKYIFVPGVRNDQLFQYYSAADVGVWPLLCSITIVEALSCSLPIIISDNSSILELVNCGNGMVCKTGSIESLTDVMEIMLNPQLRRVMSINAREYAKNNDWSIISNKFLELVDI